MSTATISVIVPVYNGARYLRDALESALDQEVRPAEVIVIDDGSTDDTRQIISSFGDRIHALHQANRGPAAARNAGLRAANGALFAFLDADDLWSADHLRVLLEPLEESPELDGALGHLQHVRFDSAPGQIVPLGDPFSTLHLGCALLRRSIFETVGEFDENMRYSEDIDWFMRAREAHTRLKVLRSVVLFYRRHDKNMTNVDDIQSLGLLKALKRSIDRRRAQDRGDESLPDLLTDEEPG